LKEVNPFLPSFSLFLLVRYYGRSLYQGDNDDDNVQQMIPTPDLSHLSKDDFLKVYEPAEDTFCLLDALEQDADRLRQAKPRLVVEIGSGSGCVSAFVGALLGPNEAAIICTDINDYALEATRKTGIANKIHLSPIRSHLLKTLQSRCHGKIDLLLFNPPYVPTTSEEEEEAQKRRLIEGSWAGGSYGTRLLDELIPILSDQLSSAGQVYIVAIQQNDPPALVKKLHQAGLSAEISFSRRAGREHLHIIRGSKA
jgi:release factor glutamine methyltransferase